MKDRQEIVMLYGPTWDAPSQVSKHHLARHWASKGHRVLYVEAPFHVFSLLTRPREVLRLWRRYAGGPQEVEPNLWIQAYPVLYPYRAGWPLADSRWMLRLNQMLVGRQLRGLSSRLGFRDPVAVVGTAFSLFLLDDLHPSLILYHCSDDYTRQPTFPASFEALERELVERSDVVICTSEELRRAKAPLHDRTYAVANGAQVRHFARAQEAGTIVAPDLDELPRPIVGYIGSVFEWVDQRMLVYAAREHPSWSFVLVGPVTTDVGQLRSLSNIHLLGPRDYADLPSYLKGFDAATVPFVFHDVTMRASPVKFYEYLASGVPIVATMLPDFEPFRHMARLVSSPEEFSASLEAVIGGDTSAKREERIAESLNHSWEARFAEVDRIIDDAVERKRLETVGEPVGSPSAEAGPP
jgi:glycosyltransferase involved in cell wall biosynthesis